MDDDKLLELFRKQLDISGEHAGGPRVSCACGRYHFAGRHDMDHVHAPLEWQHGQETPEEKELAELQAKAKAEPDNYVEHTNEHTVVMVRVNGVDYVEECPCGWDRKMSRFFIAEQELIVRFLAAVIEEQNAANAVESAIQRVIAEKNFNPKAPILTTDQIRQPYKGPR